MAHTEFCLRTDAVLTDDAAHELRKILRDTLTILRPFNEIVDCTFEIVPASETIEIRADDYALNPLEDSDEFFVMACPHPRYALGHKNAETPYTDDDKLRDDVLAILPLYLYDHSGITMNTTGFDCGWDSGQVGWIYCTKASLAVTGTTGTPAQLRQYMKDFVDKTYDPFLRGSCWQFAVTDENDEYVDSCCGFIGDTLENTGILDHFDATQHDEVKAAWERRFER